MFYVSRIFFLEKDFKKYFLQQKISQAKMLGIFFVENILSDLHRSFYNSFQGKIFLKRIVKKFH